jgi:hypothetical protein
LNASLNLLDLLASANSSSPIVYSS